MKYICKHIKLLFHMILLDVNRRISSEFATQGPILSYNWKKLTYMHISISRTNVYLDAASIQIVTFLGACPVLRNRRKWHSNVVSKCIKDKLK